MSDSNDNPTRPRRTFTASTDLTPEEAADFLNDDSDDFTYVADYAAQLAREDAEQAERIALRRQQNAEHNAELDKRGGDNGGDGFARGYRRRSYEIGDTFGLLTLVRRDWQDGFIGQYHDGFWIAKCECGELVRVHVSDLRRGSRKGYSCSACPPPPRRRSLEPRKLNAPHPGRPVDTRHRGRIYGRLTVGEWIKGLESRF